MSSAALASPVVLRTRLAILAALAGISLLVSCVPARAAHAPHARQGSTPVTMSTRASA
ncbi:MAG TPA: hypothetical protein VMU52_02835 [Steroidobacteraceae bacterium]|nr:hypothetical protein [Steroidobacteraceae bacterium]